MIVVAVGVAVALLGVQADALERKGLVVSCGPASVKGFLGSTQLKAAADGLGYAFLGPPCDECGAKQTDNMTNKAYSIFVGEKMWPGVVPDAPLTKALGDLGITEGDGGNVTGLVVSVDCDPTSELVSKYSSVQFVAAASGAAAKVEAGTVEYAQGSATLGNYKTLVLASNAAAYENGVLAALQARRGNERVAVLYDAGRAGTRANAVAFAQGVQDAMGKSVCVLPRALHFNASADARGANFAVAFDVAQAIVKEHVDVLYSQLGFYDTAVVQAVKEKAEQDYSVNVVTSAVSGSDVGRAKTLGSVLLASDELDYTKMLQAVSQTGGAANPFLESATGANAQAFAAYWGSAASKSGDLSFSSWTAVNASRTASPTVLADMKFRCPAEAENSTLSVVAAVADGVAAQVATDAQWYTRSAPASFHLPNDTCVPEKASYVVEKTSELATACVGNNNNKSVVLLGVGIYIVNLGSVDLKSGSYYADYNLYLHASKVKYATRDDARASLSTGPSCEEGGVCQCPSFGQNEWRSYIGDGVPLTDVMNIVNIDRVRTVTPVQRGNTTAYYRVQGTHLFRPSLKDWPMDTQELPVKIEDLLQSTTDEFLVQLCHMPHFSGVAPGARFFPGMELGNGRPWGASLSYSCWPYLKYPDAVAMGECTAGVNPNDVAYPQSEVPSCRASCSCLGGTKLSSRYTFTLKFQRPKLPSFLKNFLPPLFIALSATGVWFLYPEHSTTRLGVCGSALISSVMFHVSLSSSMPDTTVLALSDRLMVVIYFNIAIAFVFVFIQTVLHQPGWKYLSWSTFRFGRAFGPALLVCTLIPVAMAESMDTVIVVVLIFCAAWGFLVLYVVLPFVRRVSTHHNNFFERLEAKESRRKKVKQNLAESTDAMELPLCADSDKGSPLDSINEHPVVS